MGVELIRKYFELTEKQAGQLQALDHLYREWNQKVNVISRKDIDNLYLHHVLHSLTIAKYFTFKNDKVLDLGTGGGFPGIPLAILFPETDFLLVDSVGKKIKVVEAVANELGLKNVTARHQRAEKVRGVYDYVITRAVTNMEKLHAWSHHKVRKKGGLIALKGGDLQEELEPLKDTVMVHALKNHFEEPFFETKYLVFRAY